MMGWGEQIGTTVSTVLFPGKVPGTTASTPSLLASDPPPGRPRAILVTSWVRPIGAKLTLYRSDGTTEIMSMLIEYNTGADPDLPWRIALDEQGLPMPDVWGYRFSTLNGQFTAILIIGDA